MTNDPAAFFREMLGQWEKMANSFGGGTLKSEAFTRSLHGANAAAMAMQAAIAPAMDKALASTNLPSRSDLADLSARVGRMEASLERIEAMLSSSSGAAPGRVGPRPRRTRQAPTASG
ncbi:hypothetical protein [Sphingomonas sp.]|uniref:hypothetical protein n=1 Tax=Sphingomonas sp. TaxID=28214 RepID=UPI002ED9AFE9